MLTLSNVIGPILASFATLFTNPTGQKAQILLVGATLATGQRAVATVACYDGTTRIVEIASQIAVWHRLGKPAVTICGVLIRDPQALLCADPAVARPRSSSGLSCIGNWRSPSRES